jgi:uncharacterized protein
MIKKITLTLLFFIVIGAVAVVIFWGPRPFSEPAPTPSLSCSTYRCISLESRDRALTVFIADTDALRIQGLSGTMALPRDHGMLFVFNQSDIHGIWMRDMQYSLDIAWLDEEKRIIHLVSHVAPESYPAIFQPERPARYVLEVAAGTLESANISLGDTLLFTLSE